MSRKHCHARKAFKLAIVHFTKALSTVFFGNWVACSYYIRKKLKFRSIVIGLIIFSKRCTKVFFVCINYNPCPVHYDCEAFILSLGYPK